MSIATKTNQTLDGHRKTAYNSTYKKLAAQCLIEALCFVSSFVVADRFCVKKQLFF